MLLGRKRFVLQEWEGGKFRFTVSGIKLTLSWLQDEPSQQGLLEYKPPPHTLSPEFAWGRHQPPRHLLPSNIWHKSLMCNLKCWTPEFNSGPFSLMAHSVGVIMKILHKYGLICLHMVITQCVFSWRSFGKWGNDNHSSDSLCFCDLAPRTSSMTAEKNGSCVSVTCCLQSVGYRRDSPRCPGVPGMSALWASVAPTTCWLPRRHWRCSRWRGRRTASPQKDLCISTMDSTYNANTDQSTWSC